MNYSHITARLYNAPLMIHPGKLDAIVIGLRERFGVPIEPSAYVSVQSTPSRGGYRVTQSGIAVIDVYGVLAHRGGLQADSSYVQGYDGLSAKLQNAIADNAVRAIVLNIDSPGGEVAGAYALADQVYAANSTKPVYAAIADCGCSAAYLLASACQSISVSQTAVAGSIGVAICHRDVSGALKKQGVAVTYIYAGSRKLDGNPSQPLSDSASAQLQSNVNLYYEMFVKAVAGYRPGLSEKSIRATEAGTFIGAQNIAAGLADTLETPDQLIQRLSVKYASKGKNRMSADAQQHEITEATAPTAQYVDALTIVQACNAASEPKLAEALLASGVQMTAESLKARIDQAKAVRRICVVAQQPEMADALVAHAATEDNAKVATWAKLVERTNATPIDAAPPAKLGARKIQLAEFNALPPMKQHDFIIAGGQIEE